MSRINDIRAWRDQTAGTHGLPHYPSDPPMLCNNKGWWQDVDALLAEHDHLLALIDELAGHDECSYDHHGYCQTHLLQDAPCPHERARALLATPLKYGESA